nr:MAG TPA: hypothetical protein [Bacteriophage sp.]
MLFSWIYPNFKTFIQDTSPLFYILIFSYMYYIITYYS